MEKTPLFSKGNSFLEHFQEEVTEPMILLLIAIGVLYSVLGNLEDALTIIVVIIILVLAEVWNEYEPNAQSLR